ncbi:unnamed protein product [Lymnaea stagnalis]|uniref:BTB domain-containing protein n=1 Tax=Lymnaea stagnalis TaxID=6523 RepID=A0AAV2IP04_LYMST
MDSCDDASPDPSTAIEHRGVAAAVPSKENLRLVVSGKTYSVSRAALLSFPNTRLGQLALRHTPDQGGRGYVFERNTKMISPILDLYRTGELHIPGNMCGLAISRELRYWGIDDRLISECCFKRYKETLREVAIVEELDRAMKVDATTKDSLSGQIWLTMERPGHNLLSWIWFGIYMTFIAMSIIVVAVSSVRQFRVYRKGQEPAPGSEESLLDNLLNTDLCTPILVFDVLGLIFFTIEPLVRWCVAPNPRKYLTKALNLLDLFLAIDHWTCYSMEWNDAILTRHESARVAHAILRALLSLRVFRIFHVARRYSKMKVLFLTFRASLAELLLLFLGLFIAVIMYATVIYYVEMLEKATNFLNIPQAIWWAIVTMTTVGYGDFYPTTVSGYFVGVLCTLSGLLLLSMPIAIIASNFGSYYNGLVAREQRDKRKEFLLENRLVRPAHEGDGCDDWNRERLTAGMKNDMMMLRCSDKHFEIGDAFDKATELSLCGDEFKVEPEDKLLLMDGVSPGEYDNSVYDDEGSQELCILDKTDPDRGAATRESSTDSEPGAFPKNGQFSTGSTLKNRNMGHRAGHSSATSLLANAPAQNYDSISGAKSSS